MFGEPIVKILPFLGVPDARKLWNGIPYFDGNKPIDRTQFISWKPITAVGTMRMGEQIERFRDAKHFNTLAAPSVARMR